MFLPLISMAGFAGVIGFLDDGRSVYGLTSEAHARKIHPWTVRLESARAGLEDALARGDRPAVVSGFADVWFWIGRVVCDALSASEDPIHGEVVSQAGAGVHEAWKTAQVARAFLSVEGR